MFGKKRQAGADYNDWTLEYKKLWQAACEAFKALRRQVAVVENAIQCIELYPDGTLKDLAIANATAEKNELVNRANIYRKAVVAIGSYYTLYWEDIQVNWHPDQWEPEIKVIEEAHRSLHKLYFIET